MVEFWLVLALGAAALWAVTNFIDKFFLTGRFKPREYLFLISALFTILPSALVPFTPIYIVPDWWLAIALGVLFAAAGYLYLLATRIEEISRVVPLLIGLQGLFTVILGGLLLGEILDSRSYVGVALLIFGAILVSVRELRLRLSRAALLILANASLTAIAVISLKYLYGLAPFLSVVYWVWLSMAITGLIIFRKESGPTIRKLLTMEPVAMVTALLSNGFVFPVAALLTDAALSIQAASLVVPVVGTQALFLLLYTTAASWFAPKVLKEEISARILAVKVLASLAIVIGLYLIS